jgi:hypothetical protein
VPASQDILGWYDLANLAALALLIVAMMQRSRSVGRASP